MKKYILILLALSSMALGASMDADKVPSFLYKVTCVKPAGEDLQRFVGDSWEDVTVPTEGSYLAGYIARLKVEATSGAGGAASSAGGAIDADGEAFGPQNLSGVPPLLCKPWKSMQQGKI